MDFKAGLTLSFKSRTNLCKLNILVTSVGKYMVSERNEVIFVLESHHPLRIVLGHREQRLQDSGHSLTQLCREAIKDQMRVLL